MGARLPNLGRFAAFASTCAMGGFAQAQWSVVRLHAVAFNGSGLRAASDGWQGGWAALNVDKPVLWHAASGQWINLAPGLPDHGMVLGMHAGSQVGQFNGHASLWFGTPNTRIDLNPGWAQGSFATAVWGDEQVGYVYGASGPTRAALWHGSVLTYTDLHPEAATLGSEATAVAAGQQGGWVQYPTGAKHAALWSGSAASFVDLNPPGAYDSLVSGMWPGQQVGSAYFPGLGSRAGYWSGTPESFVSLYPAGAPFARVFATCGTAQVGVVGNAATIWFGSVGSTLSLHSCLPAGQYQWSEAYAVAIHDGKYYVGGTARTALGVYEAWLWIGKPSGTSNVGTGVQAVSRRPR